MADVEANLQAQRGLYGEPLGEVLGRCGRVLGLSQARLAGLLGISAPMLSQLMSAQRIKIGNPAAAHRLQVLLEAVDDVEAGRLGVEDVAARVADSTAADVLTGTTRRQAAGDRARDVQSLFRRRASAADYLAAADLVAATHPKVAELLRVLGAGREDEAIALLDRA